MSKVCPEVCPNYLNKAINILGNLNLSLRRHSRHRGGTRGPVVTGLCTKCSGLFPLIYVFPMMTFYNLDLCLELYKRAAIMAIKASLSLEDGYLLIRLI